MSATTVVIQSRLASSRLPAKALLPIGRHPAVVLCGLRAANTGLGVVVATSDSSADDAIADAVKAAGIECFRGPHDDVLQRFVQATRALPQDGTVVRLTADNLFPDGTFITAVLRWFSRAGVDYVGTGSPQSGLPYGMSVEAFSVASLRRADSVTCEPFDREHVTPWIKRSCAAQRYLHPVRHASWPRLRCTLDTFEDYESLLRVFADIRDPVAIDWQALVGRLAALSPGGNDPRCPYRERPDGSVHSILTIGGAQIGSKYGIANRSGMPSWQETRQILDCAADAGITSIDTASIYGASEEQIGRLLPKNFADQIQITTKLDVLADIPADAMGSTVAAAVDASVFKSLYRLRRRRIDSLLLHRWAHHDAWGGAAWARLRDLKNSGLIGRLGASVSDPIEAMQALSDPELGQLQCPVNVLDGRWRDSGFLAKAATRPDVLIHARSVLLQGLLTLPAEKWIAVPGVDASQLCEVLDRLVARLDRADRVDLSIAYVAALPWVTSLVIGVESLEQLRSNLRYVQAAPLSAHEMAIVDASVPMLPDRLLNPALWSIANA